jgi:hypothetical protein
MNTNPITIRELSDGLATSHRYDDLLICRDFSYDIADELPVLAQLKFRGPENRKFANHEVAAVTKEHLPTFTVANNDVLIAARFRRDVVQIAATFRYS